MLEPRKCSRIVKTKTGRGITLTVLRGISAMYLPDCFGTGQQTCCVSGTKSYGSTTSKFCKRKAEHFRPQIDLTFLSNKESTYPGSVQGIVKICSLWCQQQPSSIYSFSLVRRKHNQRWDANTKTSKSACYTAV